MFRIVSLLCVLSLSLVAGQSFAAGPGQTPAENRPDFSGTYNAATLTPLERPPALGERAYLTPEEARELALEEARIQVLAESQSSADREAPPEGGAKVVGLEHTETGGNEFGAGNVGAYNMFWMDRGTDAFTIDGKVPTSILIEPKNGRLPPMTPDAAEELMVQLESLLRPNDGTAWWVHEDRPGPYDGPESLPLRERCLLGFTGVAPTLPGLYNNMKRIVQTETHVVILLEMVHDARVVRMNSKHPGPESRYWLGDSIGWWDNDTLVVDTTNFRPQPGMRGGGSVNKHVVERFTMQPNGDVIYRFTVEDETVWTQPWTGEYLWRASDDRVYEYACHEGNYAMTNVLRGARLLEQEELAKSGSD